MGGTVNKRSERKCPLCQFCCHYDVLSSSDLQLCRAIVSSYILLCDCLEVGCMLAKSTSFPLAVADGLCLCSCPAVGFFSPFVC